MKIAYDPQIFFEQAYGGVSRYICEIAKRISMTKGVKVSIAAPMHVNSYLEYLPQQIVSGFRLSKTDQLGLPLRGVGMLIGDCMLRAMSPDIVHETYYFPYRIGPRRSRRVLTIHDMIHEKFAPYFTRTDKTAKFKKLAAERADHIICVSESTRRDAIDILGLNPDKVSVIYQGFGLSKSNEIGNKDLVLKLKKPFLLYVGNRGRYKNFTRLLHAYGASLELRKRYDLVCFGGGSFGMDEVDVIRSFGLGKSQVMQLGGSDHILAELYKRAVVLVYPSLYEGFGLPPLEAMSYDCPVVCSDSSSIPEVVGDAGEYFDPYNIDCMREAVERVANSDVDRAALIAKGRERIKIFSWDRCAAQTLEIYLRLI